ncbi:MAG: efflux RND transporter periplasmic adaptor subunit [Ghiorsea sp.]
MNKQISIVAALMLTIGLGAGYMLSPSPMDMKATNVDKQSGTKADKEVLFYRNPMNPNITSQVAAKDEMGMDYIPVYAGGNEPDGPVGTVSIDPTVVQNIGVRTTKAVQKDLSRTIRTIGRVTYDEERVTLLHPKYDGWVEKMFIDRTGDHVGKDTMLMSIYSPQLVATQEEYLLALNNAENLKDSPFKDVRDGALSLLESARERLELLDVPQHQIMKLNRERKVMKGLHIHSPFDGIVMNIGAREGQRITPNTELYKIADLSRVWVVVDLYDDDLPWVQVGDMADMKVAGIPGRVFKGKVSFIYPYLEAKTRTVKMRLEFDNPKLELKPEMFANVTVMAGKQVNAVVVPSEAIIRTGEQDQVFIQREAGKYEPRQVMVGVEAEGLVQIVEGVQAGETVVTSGQFLIDSESKLKEATAKMLGNMADDAPADMEMGMDMDSSGMNMDEDMNMSGMDGMHEMNSSEPMNMKSGADMNGHQMNHMEHAQ